MSSFCSSVTIESKLWIIFEPMRVLVRRKYDTQQFPLQIVNKLISTLEFERTIFELVLFQNSKVAVSLCKICRRNCYTLKYSLLLYIPNKWPVENRFNCLNVSPYFDVLLSQTSTWYFKMIFFIKALKTTLFRMGL